MCDARVTVRVAYAEPRHTTSAAPITTTAAAAILSLEILLCKPI
jgi:hypothetical protein